MKILNRKGISLVDLVIGVALLVVIILGAFMSLKALSQGRGAVSLSSKANNKLRTVAEMIRYEAGQMYDSEWDNITWPQEYAIDIDPAVKVLATIQPISSEFRSREVQLVATWKDMNGVTKTKTMNFNVSRIRTKKVGAMVRLRVVKKSNPNQGIPGVRAYAQSIDEGFTETIETDADGYLRRPLTNVYVGATGAQVWVSGSVVYTYHPGPEPDTDPAARKFEKVFIASPTVPGQVNSKLVDDPIKMIPPGAIEGYVRDALDGNAGIANAAVQIFPKSLDIATSYPSSIGSTVTTNAQGKYSFPMVIPGKWFCYSYGNDMFAAPAREGDHYQELGNNDWFTVASGPNAERPDILTTKRGNLAVQVYRTDYSAGQYQSNSGAYQEAATIQFDVARDLNLGYHDNLVMPGVGKFQWSNTNAWKQKWQSLSSEPRYSAVGGTLDIQYFGPVIINRDLVQYSAGNQFTDVRIEPTGSWVPSPYTPVRVIPNNPVQPWPLNPADVKFLLVNNSNQKIAAPSGTSIDIFKNTHVKANSTTTSQKVFFLNRNTFGNITGDIKYDATTYVMDIPDTGVGTVSVTWGNPYGWGGLRGNGAGGSVYLNNAYGKTSVRDTTAGTHRFTMTNVSELGGTGYALPPNLPGDLTRLSFYRQVPVDETRSFVGVVTGKRKVLVGTDMTFPDIPASEMDATFRVKAFKYSGGSEQWDEANFQVLNGAFGASGSGYSRLVPRVTTFSGNSDPVAVPVNGEATTTIWVTKTVSDFMRYHLKIISSSDNRWGWNWKQDTSVQQPGPVFKFDSGSGTFIRDTSIANNTLEMSVYRRIPTTVSGYVYDIDTGTGVPNMQVQMWEKLEGCSGRCYVDGNYETVMTDANGFYTFPERIVTPYPEWNIKVKALGNVDYEASDPPLPREVFEYIGNPNCTLEMAPIRVPKKTTGDDGDDGDTTGDEGSG